MNSSGARTNSLRWRTIWQPVAPGTSVFYVSEAEVSLGSQPSGHHPALRQVVGGQPINARNVSYKDLFVESGLITLPAGHRGRKPPTYTVEEPLPRHRNFEDWARWWMNLAGFQVLLHRLFIGYDF